MPLTASEVTPESDLTALVAAHTRVFGGPGPGVPKPEVQGFLGVQARRAVACSDVALAVDPALGRRGRSLPAARDLAW